MSRSPRLPVATSLAVAALIAVPALAAADDDLQPPAPGASMMSTSSSTFRQTHRCGTSQVNRAAVTPSPVVYAGGPRTIYLNRTGGTYHIKESATNSATQTARASIIAGDGRAREAVIPALGAGFDWPTIVACVKNDYQPYNVNVVEERPASGLYVEAVVGGFGTEIGFPRNALFGIASADNFCGVTEAGIAFAFSETHRGVPEMDLELCATIAHEVGHLLALEHEALGTDLMSYVLVSDTTSKAFVDQASRCGTDTNDIQNCSCSPPPNTSTNMTNSAAELAKFVGLKPRLGQGEACTSGSDCEGGQCIAQGGEQFCTQTCDPAADSCPDGWACTSAGAFSVCANPSEGGCCSTGSGAGSGATVLALGVGLLLIRPRRRR